MTRESSSINSQKLPPRPYLTREETNRKLEVLGFTLRADGSNLPNPGQEDKFQALLDLLGGAIAELVDLRPEGSWEEADAELQEWSEEWLVG